MSPNPLAGLVPVRPQAEDPMGLLAVGGEITAQALFAAVQLGLFPWTGRPPIPWCSPDPRAVLEPGSVRVPRSLRKSLRNRGYRVTYDQAFGAVVRACATTPRPSQPGTWMTPNLTAAWTELHQLGFYHSVEVWREDELVGGLVGMALGACFFGDTMFHHARDASKVALVTLCRDLREAGFKIVDAQAPTPHLRSLGALELSRTVYLLHLKAALQMEGTPGSWQRGIPPIGKRRTAPSLS